jgi:hypothetical protein
MKQFWFVMGVESFSLAGKIESWRYWDMRHNKLLGQP